MQNPNENFSRQMNFFNGDDRILDDFEFLDQRFPTNANEKIPCEFCKKLLDFDTIILHQVIYTCLKSSICVPIS